MFVNPLSRRRLTYSFINFFSQFRISFPSKCSLRTKIGTFGIYLREKRGSQQFMKQCEKHALKVVNFHNFCRISWKFVFITHQSNYCSWKKKCCSFQCCKPHRCISLRWKITSTQTLKNMKKLRFFFEISFIICCIENRNIFSPNSLTSI